MGRAYLVATRIGILSGTINPNEIKRTPGKRLFAVRHGRTPAEGPDIGEGRAVKWKKGSRYDKTKRITLKEFVAYVKEALPATSAGLATGLSNAVDKVRATSKTYAKGQRKMMTLYNGRWYTPWSIALMQAAGR